jgi:ribose/xylose/arabinose/galactoside ABC-type transport system permease subunit
MWLVLSKTLFGQYVYATGGNKRAAWLSGVNTDRIKIAALMLSGVFASIGGIIYNLRILMCSADALSGYELTVMASCIIGGTSLEGGKGSVPGAIIGALIMGMLINILQIAGVSSFWQSAVTGVIIIGAVGVDSLTSRVKE